MKIDLDVLKNEMVYIPGRRLLEKGKDTSVKLYEETIFVANMDVVDNSIILSFLDDQEGLEVYVDLKIDDNGNVLLPTYVEDKIDSVEVMLTPLRLAAWTSFQNAAEINWVERYGKGKRDN